MAIHSFSWQVLSHSKMLDLISPTDFEKKELTETKIDGVGSEVLLRETLRNVTIDNLMFKKVTPLTRSVRVVVGAAVTCLVGLTIAPCGVFVNGVMTAAVFIKWKWNKTGVEGEDRVKAFAKAFFCDFRAVIAAFYTVGIASICTLMTVSILSNPLLSLSAKVLGGVSGAFGISLSLIFSAVYLKPSGLAPGDYFSQSLNLREKFGLIGKEGALLIPSTKNVLDCEMVHGKMTLKGPLLELYRKWYSDADVRLTNLSPDPNIPLSLPKLCEYYKGNKEKLWEIEKYVCIKKGVENELRIPISDLPERRVIQDRSFTSKALLHRNVLKWIIPPKCEEQRLQPVLVDTQKPLYSRLSAIDLTAKMKEVNPACKAFRAVRRVVVLAAVSIGASLCGVVVNGAMGLGALVNYTIKKNPTDKDSERVSLYAKAFFKDLGCLLMWGFATMALTVGILNARAVLFKPISSLAGRTFLLSMSVFTGSFGAYFLGISNPIEVLSDELTLGEFETQRPFRMVLKLYEQFGLTDKNGNLLSFSKADQFNFTRVDGVVKYDDPLLKRFKEFVDQERAVPLNQKTPDEAMRSACIIEGVEEIVKYVTGRTLNELYV